MVTYVGEWKAIRTQKTVGSCCKRFLGHKLRNFGVFLGLCLDRHYFFNSMYGLKYLQISAIKNFNP